jgi:hypothetical protein
MAQQFDINADDDFFLGEDKTIEFTILDADSIPVNVTGWAIEWVVRKLDDSDSATLTKTTGGGGIAITGVYNVDPAVNTQLVVVTVEDTDTSSLTPRTYRHALKRTDDGFETILSYGNLVLRRAAAR